MFLIFLKKFLATFFLINFALFFPKESFSKEKKKSSKLHILEIIEKKRDKMSLTEEEIDFFVQEYSKGKVPEYQASSFLMAIFINGMTHKEIAYLTNSMAHSGEIVDFKDFFSEPIVDKHTTGGVGDTTSLIVVPICGALGLKVPMISGRGLGYTGGTLDKLESIPGFNVDLDLETYKEIVKKANVCITGPTKEIAPADKKIYAMRNASGTVPNKALVASSILSKKLAEDLDILVMDVKTGYGALMHEYSDALELAEIMTSIGKNLNKKVVVLITDMNQPLGICVGNALEIMEAANILQANCLPNQQDLKDLCFAITSQMLILSQKADNEEDALNQINSVIEDGSAFNKFKEMVALQGGNPEALSDFSLLPQVNYSYFLKAPKTGYISELNALEIAKGCFFLGSGRLTINSSLDYGVGVIINKKIGDYVNEGDIILEVKYNSEKLFDDTLHYFENAYKILPDPVNKPILIKKIL